MIGRLVAFSARRPAAVLALAALLSVGAYFAQRSLVRDVLPDLSDPQVVLVAEWMGHPATQVASELTEVITKGLEGVPGSIAVRGSSMAGMAYLDVTFDSPGALARGRTEIIERMQRMRSRLPDDAVVRVGPEASSIGWIFQYALLPPEKTPMPMGEAQQDSPQSLLGIRRFHDEVLRPALSKIPGVAEVATLGGQTEEVLVQTSPEQLRSAGAAFSDLVSSLERKLEGNTSLGLADLENVPVLNGNAAEGATLVRDVARVRIAPAMANAMTDVDGAAEAVGGIVIAKRDADVARVTQEVKRVIDSHRHHLPPGVQMGVLYDRSLLGGRIERTLHLAVAEELLVVGLVVLLFLLHFRSALLPLLTLPLVVLFTFAGMRFMGVPATVMSLGGIAIALGMAVDADLVALEACHRGLEHRPEAEDRRSTMLASAGTFAPAILTSLVIAALAFVPVLAFDGEAGRLLRPLALTKTLVVLGAALVALTVAPALRDRLLGARVVPELHNPLTRGLIRIYRPFVHFALAHPVFTLATAALVGLSCLLIVPRLGSEFLPRIDEGDVLYMPTTSPGVTAEDAAVELRRQDLALAMRPEVATVFGKVGRADTATDPAPFSMAETVIRLKPRAEWPKVTRLRWYSSWAPPALKKVLQRMWPEQTPQTQDEVIAAFDADTRLPGWTNAWTAPVRARIDMMSTGLHTPVGIRIVAKDPERLESLGRKARAAVAALPGTRSAIFESLGGETRLDFVPDATALDRLRVDPAVVKSVVDLMAAGGQVGQVQQAAAGIHVVSDAAGRAPVRVSLDAPWLKKPLDDQLREATVRSDGNGGQPVPLALLGHPEYRRVPAMLRAERGERVAYVYVDLEPGIDVGRYVAQARNEVDHGLAAGAEALLPGERLEWTGQYELLEAGERRLKLVAIAVAVLMLGLLFWQFRSLTEAVIVLVSVPFALVGSFWTLYLLDYPLSAPVWVGLLSVVGLAMQTGVVMVVYIDDAFHQRVREGRLKTREDIVAAHAEGTVRRLRPKVMTITTMGAALLPLMWADGSGAEIMRRVAAPMLGGLVTSAFLTLEVIPVLYTIWRSAQLRAAERQSIPLQEVVGAAPGWARARV